MTEIIYQVKGVEEGSIYWAAAEEFEELKNNIYDLGRMEAKDIYNLQELSVVAKILLSAVAGAVIQHLLDAGVSSENTFSDGKFWIK